MPAHCSLFRRRKKTLLRIAPPRWEASESRSQSLRAEWVCKKPPAVEHLELARKFSNGEPAGAQLGILLLGASCKPLGNLGQGQQWRPASPRPARGPRPLYICHISAFLLLYILSFSYQRQHISIVVSSRGFPLFL